jgi:hypothetical protein
MASLALPIIGAAGSLIDGFLSGSRAKSAGKTLANAGNTSNQIIQDVTKTGEGFVSGATTGAQATVADATAAAQNDATAAQQNAGKVRTDVFNQQTGVLNPYLAAGSQGVGSLMTALQPGGSLTQQYTLPTAQDVENTPGYKFQLNQGTQALARSAAAGGNLMSGGTAKALDQYSQGLASTYYQNAVNNSLTAFQTNRNNTLGGLMALSGFGLPATGQFNQAAQNYGNGSAGDIMDTGRYVGNAGMTGAQYIGNAGMNGAQFNANYTLNGTNTGLGYYMQGQQGLASGQMGQGNAWTNAVNGFAGAAGYGVGNMMRPSGPYNTGSGMYGPPPPPGYNGGYDMGNV